MRAVAVLILLATMAAALLASNRERPLLVERHSPGEWKHDADFPLCVTVKPPPLVKRTKPVFYPRNSETDHDPQASRAGEAQAALALSLEHHRAHRVEGLCRGLPRYYGAGEGVMPSFPTLTARAIFFIVGILVLIGVVAFTVRSCDSRHNKAAQTRVERSQAEAASNSAADAIGTVAASGEAERASEDLTRINEQQIRAAEGSNAAVNPAARDAGIAALCRRQVYANDPRCKK